MDDPAMRYIRETRGLAAKIAEAIGVKRQAIYQWKRVPPDRVNDVAAVIEKSPHFVRPDLYKKGQR